MISTLSLSAFLDRLIVGGAWTGFIVVAGTAVYVAGIRFWSPAS